MYQQEVKGKKLSPLAGVGIILLIVISIMAAGLLEQVIAQMTGNSPASMLVWLPAALGVFILFRLGVRDYRYTVGEGRLIIEARYGNNVRVIYDIPLASMLAIGPEEEIYAGYANGQTIDKVFTRGCGIEPRVIAYRKDDQTRLLLFQPDGQLLHLIQSSISGGEAK